MILPVAILILATLVAGVVAYGTHPGWAQYHHGLELILWARRLQWPLIAVVIVLATAVLGLIISGKRRAWWLIGLAPILALFAHRFALDPDIAFAVNRQPVFISAENATFVADDDYVVGVVFHGHVWAYPYASLYAAPLVVQVEQDTPMMLMWSPFANRALAVQIDRSIKARELEIVSMPANMLLIYNSRLGQFINGITGKTINGQSATGIGSPIPTLKTTWKAWKALHPQSQVLAPPPSNARRPAPTRAVLPFYPMPRNTSTRPSAMPMEETTIALIATTRPSAVIDSAVSDEPAMTSGKDQAYLLRRDPKTGALRVYDRRSSDEMFLSFRLKTAAKFPDAALIDTNSNSLWTLDGRAIEGTLKGQHLRQVDVDDGVYLEVIRPWFPDLNLLNPQPVPDPDKETTTTPPRTHRPHRAKPPTPQQ